MENLPFLKALMLFFMEFIFKINSNANKFRLWLTFHRYSNLCFQRFSAKRAY